MPLESADHVATLSGVVTVDEVETLVSWLRSTEDPKIDLRDCNHLHTGAFQAMLLFRPKVIAAPADAFLTAQVLTLLAGSDGASDPAEGEPP